MRVPSYRHGARRSGAVTWARWMRDFRSTRGCRSCAAPAS